MPAGTDHQARRPRRHQCDAAARGGHWRACPGWRGRGRDQGRARRRGGCRKSGQSCGPGRRVGPAHAGEIPLTAVAERSVRFVSLSAQTETLEPALMEAIAAVLRRGDFILGQDVEQFEREFADYCRVADAVGTDSGLSALELALRAIGVGPGHEVVTQANTFIATVGAILAVGARPVLVDCDDSGTIVPDDVAAAVTPRTRAIMPVHLFGRICDI